MKKASLTILPGVDAPIKYIRLNAEYAYYGKFAEIRFCVAGERHVVGLNDDKVSVYKEVIVDEKLDIKSYELYILKKSAGKGTTVYFAEYKLELEPFELSIVFGPDSANVKAECNIYPKTGGKVHTFIELSLKVNESETQPSA